MQETHSAHAIAERLLDAGAQLAQAIAQHRMPSSHQVARIMDGAFATGHTSRGWSPRDAEEAGEIAIVMHLRDNAQALYRNARTSWDALQRIDDVARCEPHQGARSEEQRRHQHFSTPWTIGWIMVEAAELRPDDLALEPSAGLGTLVALARTRAPDTEWHINEIEPVRHEVLKALFPEATHTALDALTLANAAELRKRRFNAVIMNPPFSRDATRARKRTGLDIHHLAAAAGLVRPRGRIVALTTSHARPGHPIWDREITETQDATTLWSKSLDATIYRRKGVSATTRVSVVEPHSEYAFRPWTPRHDEHYDDPAELLGSVLTELAGRADTGFVDRAATRAGQETEPRGANLAA